MHMCRILQQSFDTSVALPETDEGIVGSVRLIRSQLWTHSLAAGFAMAASMLTPSSAPAAGAMPLLLQPNVRCLLASGAPFAGATKTLLNRCAGGLICKCTVALSGAEC